MSGKRLPHLLVLTSTYPRWAGDPEPGFVHELAKRLITSFNVTVVCPHAAGALRRECLDGVQVIRYRYAPESLERLVNDGGIVTNLRKRPWTMLLVPTFMASLFWATFRLIKWRKVDVVHAHWLIPQGLVIALMRRLKLTRVPFLVTSHGADLFALRGALMSRLKRFVFHSAKELTVVSEGMKSEVRNLGLDVKRIRVEPMGVDLSGRFCPDSSIQRTRNQILFVGRLVEKKGLRQLIDAMPIVLDRCPEVELVIVGYGPEEQECRRRVCELGLEKKVHFAGAVQQSRLPDFYRRAALFVAPFVTAASGDQDGLGLVLLEALGCGCRVVVSDLPATRGLIGLGAALTAVEPGSSQSLAQGILHAMADADVERPDLGAFDWSSRAEAYAALLRSAAGMGR